MQDKKVGFIGAGNMASALVRGLLHGGAFLSPHQVIVSATSRARLERLSGEYKGLVTTLDNAELCAFADVIVLAVKPQIVDKVLAQIAPHLSPRSLLVSVAAGVSTSAIESRLNEARVVRAMPNTAATVLAGATAICAGSR